MAWTFKPSIRAGFLKLVAAAWALQPPAGAAAQQPLEGDKYESFGAVVAPAALPAGTASAYGYAGVQEIGAGYRQGVSALELEARAKFNYFLVAASAEVLLKHALMRGPAELAPFFGLGLTYDTGSRYINGANFQYTGARALGGLVATYRLGEIARAIAELDVPLDISLNPSNGTRFAPLAGGGAEVYLGADLTGLIMGQLGVEVLREPQGVPQVSLGYQVRVGLGFRLF